MCCFHLHFSDFIVLFFQKMQYTFEKLTCCAKREKKITCHKEKSQPPGYHMIRPLLVFIYLMEGGFARVVSVYVMVI